LFFFAKVTTTHLDGPWVGSANLTEYKISHFAPGLYIISLIITAAASQSGRTAGSTWRLKNSCMWLGDQAISRKGSSGSARNAEDGLEVWRLPLVSGDDGSSSSLH